MEAFAMFASDLDPASRAQLARGARLVELLKQKQSSPYPVEDQVVSIWAGTTGQLDDIEVSDIRRFESEFLDLLRRSHPQVLASIRDTHKLDDDTRASLTKAVSELKGYFSGGAGGVAVGTEEFEEIDAAHIDQAKIVKANR
jgi:F-type H+-transporting ATPase subunit alpha